MMHLTRYPTWIYKSSGAATITGKNILKKFAEMNGSLVTSLPRSKNPGKGKKVSFFGLGNMGKWMSGNLSKAGYTVYGFDISAEALKAASELVKRFLFT